MADRTYIRLEFKELFVMKNVLVSLFVFVALTVTQAFGYDFKTFSSDSKIIAAMQLLEQSGEYEVFTNMKKNAIKVKFDVLPYSNVYAANVYDHFGRRIIVINSIYKDAPIEQIACLIAHESCHVARKATLDEETVATSKEAKCWAKLKQNGKTYPQNKLTRRLDKITNLYITSIQDGNNYIEDKIASSSFYRSQYGFN